VRILPIVGADGSLRVLPEQEKELRYFHEWTMRLSSAKHDIALWILSRRPVLFRTSARIKPHMGKVSSRLRALEIAAPL
jgi:hypothetical protein